MEAHRWIIHLDLDAFFCAVEEQRDPRLRGLPFAVGGRPNERGVVSSCSYAARRYGVHSAMPMAQALRLCPQLKILSPHHGSYKQASHQVMDTLHELTPSVEQISIDEAFIEVTGSPAEVADIARDLQRQIREGLGLPCSLGVSSNKLVAKIATDVGKAASKGDTPPNAITIVPAGDEAAFLAPLPVEMLWGVGGKTAVRLAKLGITTIGDLAGHPEWELVRTLGKVGWDLVQRARGIDKRPIVTSRQAKSISQEVTFAHDLEDGRVLRQTLRDQAEQVTQRLDKQNLTAKTVKLKLRWPDFTTLTRQTTLTKPTHQEEAIAKAAIQLFERVWENGRAVRLLGLGVSGLDSPPRQIGLWDAEDIADRKADTEKERRLQAAIKALQERFGEQVLWRGLPEE